MPRSRHNVFHSAFTLIELLCVIAIILILVGLMLGPVLRAYKKAKNFGWESDSWQMVDRFRERMSQHFGSAPEFPALTVDQLYEAGLIDSSLRTFLRNKSVQFFPFSSQSPEEMVILHVAISRTQWFTVTKGDLKPKE